jgi:hypothetical protein
MTEIMPPEVFHDLQSRAHGIVLAWLRADVEGLVALVGDDADELLPMVTKILCEALLQLVPREEVERQLDEWFAKRLAGT